MLESAVGVSVSATRQNSGRPVMGAPVGGVNVPAGTTSAVVIVASAIGVDARLAQVAADAAPANVVVISSAAADARAARFLGGMACLLVGRTAMRPSFVASCRGLWTAPSRP